MLVKQKRKNPEICKQLKKNKKGSISGIFINIFANHNTSKTF